MNRVRASRIRSLFHELRRRRVFRAVGVYIVASLAALQAASVVAPALYLPGWTMTLLVVLALAGLPIAFGLAWVFDVVPDRRGHRLRLESTHDLDARRSEAAAQALSPVSIIPCIAVMPFLNLSGDAQNEIFVDGITEDVIAHLSKIRALKVIARNSVMPFAAEFDPDYDRAYVTLGWAQLKQGNVAGGLANIERAFDERAGAIYAIKGSFLFAPLREHPRFQALLTRLHLN